MGCKFGYIETVFRDSNPELADKLNAEHETIIRDLLASGKFEISEDRKLVKVQEVKEDTQAPDLLESEATPLNTVDVKLRDKYFAEGDVTTDTKVLEDISKSNHPLNEVAKHLLKYAKDVPVELVAAEDLGNVKIPGFEGSKVSAHASSLGVKIAEFSTFKGQGAEPTIIHEVLHTLTSDYLRDPANKDTQLYKDFESVYNKAKEQLQDKTDSYALANMDEFIVALFTNSQFINDLKEISPINKDYKNLLEEAFNHILSLFKIEKDSSLYGEAFAMASNVIEADNKAFKEFSDSQKENEKRLEHLPPIEDMLPSESAALPEGVTVAENGEVTINVVNTSKPKTKIQEDFAKVNKSRIVYFNGHKGGELSMNLDSKNPQAEILIPSKFKTEKGELIDLYEGYTKENREGKYIKVKNGALTLKEEMFDPELLDAFMFRIPTSSHGLGIAVKVVGLLPPESGDLAITPRNFITKMGQDFDVDKLTAYAYNHIVNKDGKIEKYSEKHKEEKLAFLKKNLNDLVEEGIDLKEAFDPIYVENGKDFNRQQREVQYNRILRLFDDYFNTEVEDYDYSEILKDKQLSLEDKIDKISKRETKKILQNKIINSHIAIFKSSSKEVQRKVHKVLSMDVAKFHAEKIDAIATESGDGIFDFSSPNYQMKKMNLGSTGTTGIGIYAKGLTFHSSVQQLEVRDKPRVSSPVEIGNFSSKGEFGNQVALSPQGKVLTKFEESKRRSVSEILDEKANTATDNEKEQVLGRVGLNTSQSIAVDNLLSLLGFDLEVTELTKNNYDSNNPFHKTEMFEGDTVYYSEYSIPYLLHSQPIIKDLFEEYSALTSVIQRDSFHILDELIISKVKKLEENNEKKRIKEKPLTGENLVEGLTYSDQTQLEVLRTYKSLLLTASGLKDISQISDITNFGKSMFETIELKDKFKKLVMNNLTPRIKGASNLVGEYSPVEKAGYVYIDESFYFKPSTNSGKMIGNALSLRHVFSDLFPYENKTLALEMESMLEDMGITEDDSISKRARAKEHIFQEVKKHLTSATRNGFFKSSSETRADLFIDKTGENVSLSTYSADLFTATDSDFAMGLEQVKNNILLSSFEYVKGLNGKPSLITFSGSNLDGTSEEYYEEAFTSLILDDLPLPPRNGKPYSTRMLANDLIKYSYSSGGVVSGAIEFHKFIPLAYLDDLVSNVKGVDYSVSEIMRRYNIEGWGQKMAKFKTQYFQNNPSKATGVKFDEVSKVGESNGKDIYRILIDNPDGKTFNHVSVRRKTDSKLKRDKFDLYYTLDGVNYVQVPVVGEFGMSEYVYEDVYVQASVIKSEAELAEEVVESKNEYIFEMNKARKAEAKFEKRVFPFGLKEDAPLTVDGLLNSIEEMEFSEDDSYVSELALSLKGFAADNTSIEIINDPKREFEGSSKEVNGQEIITLNLAFLKDKGNKHIAETIMHEFVHSITVRKLNPFYDSVTDSLKPDAPQELKNVMEVYQTYKKAIKEKYPTEYAAFMKRTNNGENTPLPSDTSITAFERGLFYGTTNLKEFLATALGNNSVFLKEAKTLKYKQSDKNILTKFGELIVNLFKTIATKEANLAEEALYTSLTAVELLNGKPFTPFKSVLKKKKVSKAFETNLENMTDAEILAKFGYLDESVGDSAGSYQDLSDMLDDMPEPIC